MRQVSDYFQAVKQPGSGRAWIVQHVVADPMMRTGYRLDWQRIVIVPGAGSEHAAIVQGRAEQEAGVRGPALY